ncbi:MAG: hypothetical protein GX962_01505 [Epulopiscium sp.]|nr:hypothetical protein [Candidatus Epulonipiscium sp.]
MTIKELEKCNPSHFYDMKTQLKDYVYKNAMESLEKGKINRSQIKTVQQLKERQSYIRERFIESLGGLPSSTTPLNPQITGQVQGNGFKIEKVVYESRPNCFVTANLYIPDNLDRPGAAVLFLCGHDPLAKHSMGYQKVCQYLVKSGLIVLAQDPIGQGERFSYYENGEEVVRQGTTEHTYAGFQCLATGYPSARYFLHDAIRSIDYLISRPEVDSSKIGVTGNSGGGTQTSMLMLCDDRIKAFAPGTFITSYEENMMTGVPQDAEQNWPGLMQYGFDHEDILLAVAPKPVAVLAVKYDFFPIEGTRRTVESAKKYWELYGKKENLYYIEDPSRHSYSVNLAKFASRFFCHALDAGSNIPLAENRSTSIKLFEPSDLWCISSGQISDEKYGCFFIYHENLKKVNQLQRERNEHEDLIKKEVAYNWLKEKVFYKRQPCQNNLRDIAEYEYGDLNIKSYIWRSQERVMNHCLAFKHKNVESKGIPAVIAVWDGGTTELEKHIHWIEDNCIKGKTVFVLNTSGVGAIAPYPFGTRGINEVFGTIYKLGDDLIRQGDSICALRTYDVLRMVDVLQEFEGVDAENISVYAYGNQGIYAQLATFIDPRIKLISIERSIPTFSDWVGRRYYDIVDTMSIVLPEVLQYFDIDELQKWLQQEGRKESER